MKTIEYTQVNDPTNFNPTEFAKIEGEYQVIWVGDYLGGKLSLALDVTNSSIVYFSFENKKAHESFQGFIPIPKEMGDDQHEIVACILSCFNDQYIAMQAHLFEEMKGSGDVIIQ